MKEEDERAPQPVVCCGGSAREDSSRKAFPSVFRFCLRVYFLFSHKNWKRFFPRDNQGCD